MRACAPKSAPGPGILGIKHARSRVGGGSARRGPRDDAPGEAQPHAGLDTTSPHLQCDHYFDNLTQDSGRGQRFSSLQRPPELTETPEMDWPTPDQGAAMTPGRLGFRTSALALVLAAAAATIILAGCGGSSDVTTSAAANTSSAGGSDTQLALVGYSTPKKAYDALTTAYEQTSQGKGVTFSQSFGASGSQSRAVASGQPADVVAFSTTPDITRLVKAGVVSKDWDANPEK